MRPINEDLKGRFESPLQTAANNTDPRLSALLSRDTIPLTSGADLERSVILETSGLTACSVAVRRPRAGREPDAVYAAYIDQTGAHVKISALSPKLSALAWQDVGFSAPTATDVALAFDGTMPKKADGTAEFVTAERPWIFWIDGGVLKGRILGLLGDVTLATANAERVSAIRATWTQAAETDFGLVVFFTLAGSLYYRQLIDGAWMDAEPVTFGPPGVTWTDIAAFRTWDYRVGVQAVGSDGKVYELFTQFQGVAKHGGEHIRIADAAASGKLTGIADQTAAEREHLSLAAEVTTPFGGLYKTGAPQLLSAENVDDGAGDWGRVLRLRLDRILDPDEVAAQNAAFRITDALGAVFVPQSAAVIGDGFTVELVFMNFNGATGACTASYAPGSVHTMAGETVPALSVAFTPQNLIDPGTQPPAPVSASNVGDTQIILTFDADLDADLTGAAAHLSALCQIPEFSPGGALIPTHRRPASVAVSGSDTLILTFPVGNQASLSMAVGDVAVVYDGAGPLAGAGVPVEPFSLSFTPAGLTYKPNVRDAENIGLTAAAAGTLTRITYVSGATLEHLEFSAAAAATLTHIDDL